MTQVGLWWTGGHILSLVVVDWWLKLDSNLAHLYLSLVVVDWWLKWDSYTRNLSQLKLGLLTYI